MTAKVRRMTDDPGITEETVEITELITPGPAEALAGLLDTSMPDLADGLPLLWHLVYLLDRAPQSALGPDGHRSHGGLPVPPGPGHRRMFAGSRVQRLRPLLFGLEATRRTRVVASTQKEGRAGSLKLVTVLHEIFQDGEAVITDEQDIIYREATNEVAPSASGAAANAIASPSPQALERVVIDVDPVLLFRFSALTYNSHRIHYDRDFATRTEGYPSLVVHGPLQAVLMCELASRLDPPPVQCRFEYRLRAPLCQGEGCVVSLQRDGNELKASVADANGRLTASGTIGC
jgi:3-methylfumaryl-CoA hydratase